MTENMAAQLTPIDEEPVSPNSPDSGSVTGFNTWEKIKSKGVSEGKFGSKCQLCQQNKTACVYCVNCFLSLCESCQNQHSKIQGTSNHVIADIDKVVETKQKHSSNGIYTADQQITGVELDGNRVMHSTKPFSIKSKVSLDSLRSSFSDYQKSVAALKSDTKNYLDNLQQARKGTENVICNHAEKLHKDIDEMKNKLLKEIKNKVEVEENVLLKTITELESAKEGMSETTNFLEAVIKCSSEMGLAELSKAINLKKKNAGDQSSPTIKAVNTTPNSIKPNEELHCSENGEDSLKLYKHRDSVLLEKVKTRPSRRSAQFDSKFFVGESLTSVTVTVDDTIVATMYSAKKCTVYTISGKHVLDITKNLVQPSTVLSLSTGKILVADQGDDHHNVGYRMYYTDGEPFPCNITTTDTPWGMGETPDGDIAICHPETHRVCIYDRKGRTKLSLKSNDKGKNHFLNPRCVCVTKSGDIVVSDFERHSLLFFSKDGEYKFSYGSLGKGPGHLHHPCGVCSDEDGNIIVADSDNHRVHLVSGEGKLRRILVTQSDGIEEPVSVCLTKDGLLVIGEWCGKVIVLNY